MADNSQGVVFRRVRGRIIAIRGGKDRQGSKGSSLRGKDARERGNRVVGSALVAGAGAGAIDASVSRITGRETFYHGTNKANAAKILKDGIKRNVGGGIGDGILDKVQSARNHTYVTPNPMQARMYAQQSEALEVFRKRHPKLSPQEVTKKFIRSIERSAAAKVNGGEVLKLSLPTWKKEISSMRVPNPELYGAKNYKELLPKLQKMSNPIQAAQINNLTARVWWNTYNTPTFKGDIGPQYIKGSKSYQKLTLKEMGQYIKARPGRFSAGVGYAAVGAAALGYGAYSAWQNMKGRK